MKRFKFKLGILSAMLMLPLVNNCVLSMNNYHNTCEKISRNNSLSEMEKLNSLSFHRSLLETYTNEAPTITEQEYDKLINSIIDETICELLNNWDCRRYYRGFNLYFIYDHASDVLKKIKEKMKKFENKKQQSFTLTDFNKGKHMYNIYQKYGYGGVCRHRAWKFEYILRSNYKADVHFLAVDRPTFQFLRNPNKNDEFNHACVLTRITEKNKHEVKNKYVIADPQMLIEFIADVIELYIKTYQRKPKKDDVRQFLQNITCDRKINSPISGANKAKRFLKYPIKEYSKLINGSMAIFESYALSDSLNSYGVFESLDKIKEKYPNILK